jgi:2-phosphosulfolactate phosphatase
MAERERMPAERPVSVHLLPRLAEAGSLNGGVAVVADVLRATTTIVHALAAGAAAVIPCAAIDEARTIAKGLKKKSFVLAGERHGKPIDGFDIGNSPREFTSARCKGKTIVMATTNGTPAIVRAAEAERVLVAAFVNFSAVCEQLRADPRPVHIVCAGTDKEVSVEDTLLAGALVDFLCEHGDVALNDSARLAWDTFENHGSMLEGALAMGLGGRNLLGLGYDADICDSAKVDRFALAPELARDPLRIERGTVGIVQCHWPR